MKKYILTLITLFSIGFSNESNAQAIDSIAVRIYYSSEDYGEPWTNTDMIIDSLSNGLSISVLRRLWVDNEWINYNYYHNLYQGSLVSESIEYYWAGIQWLNWSKYLNYYSATVDSSIYQTWNNAWENVSITIRYYNSIGLDSLIITQNWNSTAWINDSKTENVFAADSSMLSQTVSDWDSTNMEWNYRSRSLRFKNALLQDTLLLSQTYGLNGWVNSLGVFMSRNTAGLIDTSVVYTWDEIDSTWNLPALSVTTNVFDSLNRLISSHDDYYPGGLSHNTWTYDSLGNTISSVLVAETNGGNVQFMDSSHLHYFPFPSPTIYHFAASYSPVFCDDDSLRIGTYSFGGIPPLQYQWTPSTGLSSDTVENPFMLSNVPFVYVLTTTDSAGNSVTDTIYAEVNPAPSIQNVQSIGTTCMGCDNGRFIVAHSGGTPPYQFEVTPVIIGMLVSGDTIKKLPAGEYTICLVDDKGCNVCIVDTILDDPLSIHDVERADIKIFPNPVTTSFELKMNNLLPNSFFDLVDQSGRKVKTYQIDSEHQKFSREDITSGIYRESSEVMIKY